MKRTSLLWVGKQPTRGLSGEGGDEIYDRKITGLLGSSFEVERFYINKSSVLSSLLPLCRGVPHPRYKYVSKDVIKEFKAAASAYDHLVVSWESFDFLTDKVDMPVTLIVHNVMSDTLRQVFSGNTLSRIAAAHSEWWERRLYANKNLSIVALSERDRTLLQKLAPRTPIYVAPPGCPMPAPLLKAQFIPEVVVSGSYEWLPKRRDLMRITNDYETTDRSLVFRHDRPFPCALNDTTFSRRSNRIEEGEYSEGLRIGLLPDTFLGGFKLKSTFYIAMNCILASKADIRSEFSDIPHAEEFVKVVRCLNDIKRLEDELRDTVDNGTFERWNIFKSASLRKFSWTKASNTIAKSLYD